MCMRPAHQLGGFVAGAALAMYAHQPLWVAVPSAAVASLTAGGRFSPDADQYKGWKLFDKYTPDELLGRGGPLQHRGITHWWLIPAAVGAGLYVAGGGAWWVWWAWVLLAGWVSHLLLDFVFGQADPWAHRGPGVPFWPWWGHHGVGLDAGGWLERRILVPVLAAAGAVALSWPQVPALIHAATVVAGNR
jgi:membrane-bound metal-dependent hydrolase YbcI (DUF457 family)